MNTQKRAAEMISQAKKNGDINGDPGRFSSRGSSAAAQMGKVQGVVSKALAGPAARGK